MAHILKHFGAVALALFTASAFAQTFTRYTSTDGDFWKESSISAAEKAEGQAIISVTGDESVMTFKGWGTCFNELGWDALQVLPQDKQVGTGVEQQEDEQESAQQGDTYLLGDGMDFG